MRRVTAEGLAVEYTGADQAARLAVEGAVVEYALAGQAVRLTRCGLVVEMAEAIPWPPEPEAESRLFGPVLVMQVGRNPT